MELLRPRKYTLVRTGLFKQSLETTLVTPLESNAENLTIAINLETKGVPAVMIAWQE